VVTQHDVLRGWAPPCCPEAIDGYVGVPPCNKLAWKIGPREIQGVIVVRTENKNGRALHASDSLVTINSSREIFTPQSAFVLTENIGGYKQYIYMDNIQSKR
jgi:hypothetical protein